MSVTLKQILLDAKRLSNRLKEHDSAADHLLSQTQTVYKQIDAMKQVHNNAIELGVILKVYIFFVSSAETI